MLGFPAHTSHRLQPLDVALYGPLKKAYNNCCDDHMVNNPGSTISIKNISAIFGKAYLKVASVRTALNGFKTTGIEPFDSTVFTEEDFEPSLTTDIPVDNEAGTTELPIANTSTLPNDLPTEPVCNIPTDQIPGPSNLPPLPKSVLKKSRKPRQKLPSLHITGTPVKNALENKRKEQEDKVNRKTQRMLKKNKANAKPKIKQNKTKNIKNKKTHVRQLEFSSSDESDTVEIQYVDTDDDMDLDDLLQDVEKDCIICGEQGKDELWYQCHQCKLWAHSNCSGWDEIQAKYRRYKCDFCS